MSVNTYIEVEYKEYSPYQSENAHTSLIAVLDSILYMYCAVAVTSYNKMRKKNFFYFNIHLIYSFYFSALIFVCYFVVFFFQMITLISHDKHFSFFHQNQVSSIFFPLVSSAHLTKCITFIIFVGMSSRFVILQHNRLCFVSVEMMREIKKNLFIPMTLQNTLQKQQKRFADFCFAFTIISTLNAHLYFQFSAVFFLVI